jgi:hypothetical protein
MENGSSTDPTGSSSPPLAPQVAPIPGPPGHRRSLSGGILSRFPFLRSTPEDSEKLSPLSGHHSANGVSQHEVAHAQQRDNAGAGAGAGTGAMASAMRQTKTRKRKGSLRKTALLGTGKMRLEKWPMDSMDSQHLHDEPEGSSPFQHTGEEVRSRTESEAPGSHPQRRHDYHDIDYDTSSSISSFALPPSAALTIDTIDSINGNSNSEPSQLIPSPPSTLASPITSPTSRYASTTDDDDGLTFSAPNVTSAADMTRRRSARSAHVQTNSLTHAHAVPPEQREHDYSDTEWWGWIILIATWIVFVVGMGSCFGVWSWAWDVGETPYAPPELEDDPTLPIVGYYPALIILTAVMAWVWVVVAWVGMKYFRHARFVDGEE